MTKRTKRVLGLTVVLISLLVLGAGCGDGPSGEEPALDGTSWKLTSWAEPDPLPGSASITAEFANSRVAGTSGVNRYNASVTSGTDGSLAVDAPISTKMAGPADVMAAESAYLRRLQAATSYQVDGDTLVINDADGQLSLTFARA
ncbi:MAG TPA: META domain-containing protein [Microlunatus sp.]